MLRYTLTPEKLAELLAADLGPVDGPMFTSDMSVEDADRLAMSRSFLKKFRGVVAPDAKQKAIDGFVADNERCRTFVLEPRLLFDEQIIGEVISFLDSWLLDDDGAPATLARLTESARTGPGVSVGVDIATFYAKLFDSPLSRCNPMLHALYCASIKANPTWARAEIARENQHGSMVVEGSKLGTVRKQYDIDRTICSEPVLEMFFQLGIGGYIEDRMEVRLGINLSTQPVKNQWLARQGSLDGSIATIDLKSASNSVSLGLTDSTLPRWFNTWLRRTRSPKTRLPNGEYLEMHMVASMGNGYCFPLQTMFFAAVVCACYRMLGLDPYFGTARKDAFLSPLHQRRDRSGKPKRINAGVFGDDIAVCREAYPLVCRALALFGFIVNEEKSFSTGPFRESCGHDYFNGVNIRGVYLKDLDRDSDCYSLINRLIKWETKTGLRLEALINAVFREVSEVLWIPYRDGDDEGIKAPRSTVGKPTYSATGARVYFALAHELVTLSIPADEDSDSLPGIGNYRFSYNADGLVVSLVAGYLRAGRISLRDGTDYDGNRNVRSKVRQRSVPNWDWVPEADGVIHHRGNSWVHVAGRALTSALDYKPD
ncbi:TPA_asm: RNA-directed RNA polymerase [ssRNA phage SRR7976310_1]|uniref:RNA-directed RNA polymerase n=1 Tax=ssRNA phage SRR7976310_1 TaxID=2786671 RepID=A0A8S5L1Z1_9VIRU|nr:RNA-directed RNA polymerase [ssRNA phage SRR7976310_1]DAD51130.1 TPA_asm: RNA-directed RNA polymerase [ssRNA phage SRR7976310_1]